MIDNILSTRYYLDVDNMLSIKSTANPRKTMPYPTRAEQSNSRNPQFNADRAAFTEMRADAPVPFQAGRHVDAIWKAMSTRSTKTLIF
jgi:hypothetical protein